MVDFMPFLYTSVFVLSFIASIKERKFFPLFIGSLCGVLRMVLGYEIPVAAQFFSRTGINGLIVIGAVTLMLEICFARDKKDLFFYFTYYIGVSFTAFLGECYGTFSGAWNNADEGFLSLPWHRILITYFLAFFVILKFGELIYFFVFKKLFTGFMDTEP